MNFDAWRHYLRACLFDLLRLHDRAIAAYRDALRQDPAFHGALVSLAFRCGATGRDEEAIQCLERALQVRPRECDTHYNLGFLHAHRGRQERAIECFRAATTLNANHDMAWYGMGLAQATLGDHAAAKDAFEQAARLQPMGSPSWYQLGMACHHACDPKRLREVILHLNRFDPKMARRLILDTGTADLAYLVKDLVV